MRIAILTFHRAYNCGAMLQAWALKTVLAAKGRVDKNDLPNAQNAWDRLWPDGIML